MARKAFLDAVKTYCDALASHADTTCLCTSRQQLLAQIAIEEEIKVAPWRRILVALDHYDHPALKVAISLAQDMDAALAFVNVVDPSGTLLFPEVYLMGEDPLFPVRKQATEFLERSRDLVPLNIPVDLLVREGKVATEIPAAAREWHADLIILGTHRRGPLGRLIFGSTSACVIPKTKCPVLLVTDDPHSQADTPAAGQSSEVSHN
ncbi:MAG TPA: universal stress protein [Phycisphaerae bacterium]|nr:universal stress protein [Phycisphaerae bacterium]